MDSEKENLVEAIEDGKIVKVTEAHAKREGLIILKKALIQNNQGTTPSFNTPKIEKESRKTYTDFYMRKPDWKEKQVISELHDNFNWIIRAERRKKGWSRKQFAKLLNEPESHIEMMELGRLPVNDFILVNKVQKALGVNLRKDGKQFDLSMKDMMSKAKKEEAKELKREGIEILDEEESGL